MYKKRKKSSDELFNTLMFMAIFIAFIIYIKTKSIIIAIIFSISLMLIFFICAKAFIFVKNEKKNKKFLNSGIDIVDKMAGEEFEEFLSVHFRKLGYKVDTTPKTNDYGADLILEKDGFRIVVQAKRWKNKVGIEAVQQIVAAINYYNAAKGLVMTNNYFTQNAYELALKNNIELCNRNKLIEIMQNSNLKDVALSLQNNKPIDVNIPQHQSCPRCGGNLVIRNGKKGMFLGCSNFPNCRFTRNI